MTPRVINSTQAVSEGYAIIRMLKELGFNMAISGLPSTDSKHYDNKWFMDGYGEGLKFAGKKAANER